VAHRLLAGGALHEDRDADADTSTRGGVPERSDGDVLDGKPRVGERNQQILR
jgi:hypothetical protein